MHKPTIVRRWAALLSAAVLVCSSMQTGVLAADQADQESYVLENVLEQEEITEDTVEETAGDETSEETVGEAGDETSEETVGETEDQLSEGIGVNNENEASEETVEDTEDQPSEGIDVNNEGETPEETEEETAEETAEEAEEAVAPEEVPAAEETAEAEEDVVLDEQAAAATNFVMMNIPYDVFYRQIVGTAGNDAIDGFSSATGKKQAYFWDPSYKGNAVVAYGEGTTLKGVYFPVKFTAEDYARLDLTAAYQSTQAYSFSAADFTAVPALYTVGTIAEDGSFSFSHFKGNSKILADAEVSISDSTSHGDYMLTVTGDGGVLSEAAGDTMTVFGAVIKTAEGGTYNMRHLENLYYKDFNQIAFCTTSTTTGNGLTVQPIAALEGQTIEEIDFLTNSGIFVVYTSTHVAHSQYVLMNIPYDKFYEAEIGAADAVDAVTSATHNKPRTGGLAGGSYHVNADGSDISGVIYPVYVKDPAVLAGYTQVTAESSVEITVTNRGQTSTTTYTGKDALFESADYSYYVLDEAPNYYKVLNADGTFSEIMSGNAPAQAEVIEGATGNATIGARHADVEISLSLPSGITTGQAVSGVIVTTDDGEKTALRHVANIWRATEIGWNNGENDITGKTITNIRYITQNGVIDYPTEICVHSLEKVEAKEADYESAGNIEYYRCSVCGKLFKDANGKEETTEEEVRIPQLVHDLGQVTNLKNVCHMQKLSMTISYAPVEYAQSYQLAYRKMGDAGWKRIRIGNVNSYELTGLEAGACYEVRVRATQQVEGTWYYGAYSRTIRRAMVNTTLQGRASKSLIRLTIGEVAGADQYQIIYADNAAMTNAKSIKTDKLNVTIRNLKAGKKYYFRVRPLFKDGTKTYLGVLSHRYAFKTKK